jgi:MinD superfamily P-loop ATPase
VILAVASGKGGTGKTTVSVDLAQVYASHVRLLDCGVEEANAHLLRKGAFRSQERVAIPISVADQSLCDVCAECSHFCQYHAATAAVAAHHGKPARGMS